MHRAVEHVAHRRSQPRQGREGGTLERIRRRLAGEMAAEQLQAARRERARHAHVGGSLPSFCSRLSLCLAPAIGARQLPAGGVQPPGGVGSPPPPLSPAGAQWLWMCTSPRHSMRMPKSQPQCSSGGLRSLSVPLPLREGVFEVVLAFMRDLPGVVTATHGRSIDAGRH